MMLRVLAARVAGLLMVFGLGANSASAVSCGTVASPTACSVVSGGMTDFSASNFQFLVTNANGGAFLYQAGDISVDIASLGGGAAELTFTKTANTPNAGTVFFVNPGQNSGFTFSYDLAITPAVPGVVDYTNLGVEFTQSHTQNALASVQAIVAPVNCNVFTSSTSNSCPLSSQPTTITAGNIVTMTGNTGNTSILNFTNRFDTRFVVPEPSQCGMIAMAFVGLQFRRRA